MSRLADPEIALILAPLRRAQRGLRVTALTDAALAGGIVGAVAFVLATLERRVVQAGLLPAGDWPADLAGAGALGLVSGAVLAVRSLRRLPDLAAMARLADRRFALDERLSTAIAARPPTGPEGEVLRRALLADAVAHLPRVSPQRLAPFAPRDLGLAFAPLAALGLAVVMLNPAPLAPVVPPAVAQAPLDDSDRAAVAEDVTRVADLIREQADRRDDAYMAAVARTLDALAQRLEQDPTLTRAEAVATLQALTAEARAAASDWRGTAGERLSEMVAALAESLAEAPPPAAAEPPQPPGALPDAMAAALNGEPQPPGAPGPAQPGAAPRDGLDAIMEQFAQSQGQGASGRQAAEGALASPVVDGTNYLNPGARGEDPAIESVGDPTQPAQLLGPSSDARAGESILAGSGTDVLDQGEEDAVAVTFQTSDDFVLEANVRGEGRQMMRDLPPEAVLTPVTAFDLAEARAAWAPLPPAAAWRDRVSAANRVALQGYFLALAAEVAR